MSLKQTSVKCGPDGVSPLYSLATPSVDFVESVKSSLKVKIISETEAKDELVFDLIGVDAPIANALRRILLAEVPSVAIETVWLYNNTSMIQDEVLALRLGLVPLNVDPRLLEFKGEGDEETDLNTVVFSMKVTGGEPTSAGLIEGDEDVMLGGNEPGPYTSVYSSSIEWTPEGSQEERFKVPAKPVHDDILVAKLAKDQCIELEAHAVKGIGKDHAKFSPVSTASYRLLPKISLSAEKPFEGDEADALIAKCPLNVFDIEDIRGPSSSKGTKRRAVVARPRDCTLCRECVRSPEWAERVTLERVSDHFIFSVESTGALPARTLVQEAIKILVEKAQKVLEATETTTGSLSSLPVVSPARAAVYQEAVMRSAADDIGDLA